MWRKAMVYLGLGDDSEYDDYDDGYDDEASEGGAARHGSPPPPRQTQPSNVSTVSPSAPAAVAADEPTGIGAVRPLGSRHGEPREAPATGHTIKPSGLGVPRPRPQVVRPIAVTPSTKPTVVAPTTFNQAQDVADKFKGDEPVVMNLQDCDRELSRRLIDFASGLCYGLGGQMERLANHVYLLTPSNIEVSSEDRRRLQEQGFDA